MQRKYKRRFAQESLTLAIKNRSFTENLMGRVDSTRRIEEDRELVNTRVSRSWLGNEKIRI